MKHTATLPVTLRRVTAVVATIGIIALSAKVVEELRTPPAKRHGDRVSPWRGLPGCLHLESTLTGQSYYWPLAKGMELSCTDGEVRTQQPQQPAHAQPLVNALYRLVEPPSNALDANADTITIEGKRLAKGSDARITLDPVATAIANDLATCLTRPDSTVCRAADVDPVRFAHLQEGAGVRMFSLVDMRLDTGAVEAIASAHTACFNRMLEGAGSTTGQGNTEQDPACPEMPAQYLQANSWRKDNHALYNQAMWGSLVKPALALALLRGGAIGPSADYQWLLSALQTSDTPVFIGRLFCQRQGYPSDCAPLQKLIQAGQSLGFIDDEVDLLAHTSSSLMVPAAHWMQRPAAQANQQWEVLKPNMPNGDLLSDCASRRWSVCKGEDLAEITAHLWGQGDSKGTALSAAAAFARLGSAANAESYHAPTLTLSQSDNQPPKVEPAYARVIVEGLSLTHREGGTAHSACLAVWGSRAVCDKLTTLAGKTGTPTMPHDAMTLDQRATHCRHVATRLALARQSGQRPARADRVENARCALAPYKWYVALAKDSDAPGAPWSRAVAIQVERNWAKGPQGRVDAAFDTGINVAAYIAMQYLRLRQNAVQPPTQATNKTPIVTGSTP